MIRVHKKDLQGEFWPKKKSFQEKIPLQVLYLILFFFNFKLYNLMN